MEVEILVMQKSILIIASINDVAPAKYLVGEFKKIGCNLLVVSDQDYENVDTVKTQAVDVKKICDKNKFVPNIILFIEGGNMNLFPINLESFQCVKYWWAIDTPHDYKKHLLISRLFDHSFVAQKEYVAKLMKDGITSISWLPVAAPISGSESLPLHKKFDVSYIGTQNWAIYPERKALIDSISNNYKDVFIGSTSANEMMQIYRESKIVFNFSLKNDVNMRIFEATGAGALLLTNEILGNGMNELFELGKDYDIYTSPENLLIQIDNYLNNDAQRLKISTSGHARVLGSYKYSDRAKEILSYEFAKISIRDTVLSDSSAALSAMNFYSDALKLFTKDARTKQKGRRSKVIIHILGVAAKPIYFILKSIEKLMPRLK
jgi:Glycosyl transferases group 1